MSDAPSGLERRRLVGGALIGLGIALLVWAVLYMNVSALGVAPAERSFAYRRPYNEVKRSAHEAFPGFLLRAGVGGLLIWCGVNLRRKAPTS